MLGTLASSRVGAQPLSITEYPLPTAHSGPLGITAGIGRNVSFTESDAGKIGVIRSGAVTEIGLSANSGPSAITGTVPPFQDLWFTEFNANQIGKMTFAGVVTEYPIPTANSAPYGIAPGPDGNAWFTEGEGAANQIGKITADGAVTEYLIPTAAAGASGIAAGPDGNLWFTEIEANQIGKVTTSGSFTEYTVPTGNSRPAGITAGPDGNLWFTEHASNQIGKVTTSGSFTEYPIPTGKDVKLESITVGPDGNLWFTEPAANQIGKITLTGAVTEYPIPTANSNPRGIVADQQGYLWFTEQDAGQIGRALPGAVTISGTITYAGSRGSVSAATPIKLYVATYDLHKSIIDKALDTATVSTNGGAFVLHVPATGNYGLFYKLEIVPDLAGVQSHVGEPFQFYNHEFMRDAPDPIAAPSSGVALTFDDTATISGVAGTVSYTGSLGQVSAQAPLTVQAFTDAGLTQDACLETSGMPPLVTCDGGTPWSNGGRFDLVSNGSSAAVHTELVLYLRAFLDLDASGQLDPGEPFQLYPNNPVTTGPDQTNINFTFGDAGTPTPTPTPLAETMLTADIGPDDTTIAVADISAFPDEGTIQIGDERLHYSGKTAGLADQIGGADSGPQSGLLHNVIRGVDGTTPAAHPGGSTVTLLVPLATPTPTPTPIPCVGDCNGSSDVTVDELLTLVNIALGNADVSTCVAGDVNHDTQITIDEILTAVNSALSGCPSA